MERRPDQGRLVARARQRAEIVLAPHAAAQHDLGVREARAEPPGRLRLRAGPRADAGEIEHDERPDARRPRRGRQLGRLGPGHRGRSAQEPAVAMIQAEDAVRPAPLARSRRIRDRGEVARVPQRLGADDDPRRPAGDGAAGVVGRRHAGVEPDATGRARRSPGRRRRDRRCRRWRRGPPRSRRPSRGARGSRERARPGPPRRDSTLWTGA